MEYQGIGIRFVSILIDSIILGIIEGVVGMALGVFSRPPGEAHYAWWIISFIIFIAYFTYLEGSKGQTVGKMITKIKVVQEDGRPIDMGQAFTRNILRIIDSLVVYLIGAILIWRSNRKQRLGDRIAKTVVIRA